SAVRVTHLPTGLVVQCQDQKSQLQNKIKALEVLRSRLLDKMLAEQEAARARERRAQVGTGDRSQKIRTYNFPQNRVTDHRIHYTVHNLSEVLDGNPDDVINARRIREAVERRARGVPFAYAVGSVGFRTLELQIDSRALIPRPETEGLVELVLEWARGAGEREEGRGRGGVAADIGTGCGCIALSLAVEGEFDRVIAVERSAAAAALARENVERVRPPVPVEVREGDVLAPLGGCARLRAIVSNPPYLTDAES